MAPSEVLTIDVLDKLGIEEVLSDEAVIDVAGVDCAGCSGCAACSGCGVNDLPSLW